MPRILELEETSEITGQDRLPFYVWIKPWQPRHCLNRQCWSTVRTQTWSSPHSLNTMCGIEPKQDTSLNKKSQKAQAKRKGLCHRTGKWLSGDTPALLLGVSSSHGACPQLLKEPDLWQRPMISAVINDAVKLINPSLCPQEKKPSHVNIAVY